MTAAITRVVSVPVTVDFEQGYSDDPATVAANVARVIDAGAVGVNLEDGGGPPELLAQKIRAVRAATKARGVDVFLNARTDVYLRGLVPPADAVAEALRRARLYAEAGSDGLFVLVVKSSADIEAIAAATPLPLNVVTMPGIAPVAELRRLGVRRLSVGPALMEVALAAAKRACVELLKQGTYGSLFVEEINYAQMNALFVRG